MTLPADEVGGTSTLTVEEGLVGGEVVRLARCLMVGSWWTGRRPGTEGRGAVA